MAGFGGNGSRTSPVAIASAERHAAIIDLRKEGVKEGEIAKRFGVSQQAVSKTLLKYVRNLPTERAEVFREAQLDRMVAMREVAIQALEFARTRKQVLRAVDRLLEIEDREAKLLGLFNHRAHSIRPRASQSTPGNGLPIFAGGHLDPEVLRQVEEIEKLLATKDTKCPS